MKINVRNKSLTLNDESVKFLNERYKTVDAKRCEMYIFNYYTDNSKTPFTRPDLNKIFAEKSEKELSKAVNEMMSLEISVMK